MRIYSIYTNIYHEKLNIVRISENQGDREKERDMPRRVAALRALNSPFENLALLRNFNVY